MTPHQDPNIIQNLISVGIWFFWALASVIYWLLNWKTYKIWYILGKCVLWGFVGWCAGTITGQYWIAWIAWTLCVEIMHSIQDYWPEIIKQKIKNLFNLK